MRRFELEAISGIPLVDLSYPGAFPLSVDTIIRQNISGKVLHLFSGSSLIGDERIDIEHPNATQKVNVKEFIAGDTRHWDYVILDPPYHITLVDVKLNGYGIKGAVSSDVNFRRKLKFYFQRRTDNILWLDVCAPMIKGFYRKKLWLVLPGGFHTVRVLSWLKREMKPLL